MNLKSIAKQESGKHNFLHYLSLVIGAYKAKVEGLNNVYTSQQEKSSLRSQMAALSKSSDIKDVNGLKKPTNELKTAGKHRRDYV